MKKYLPLVIFSLFVFLFNLSFACFGISNTYFIKYFCVALLIEYAFVTVLCAYNIIFKILGLIVVFAVTSNVSSLYVTGLYVIPLTLDNLGDAQSIATSTIAVILCIFVVNFLYWLYLARFKWNISRKKLLAPLAVLFIVFTYFFCTSIKYTISGFFFKTCSAYLAELYEDRFEYINPTAEDFKKFEKDYVVKNSGVSDYLIKKPKNVIVIFTEGLSAECIDYPSVMPNLKALKDKSLYVDNYFNHTAATFRGIRGQLLSGYEFRSGYNNSNDGLGQTSDIGSMLGSKIPSLAQILNSKGYDTNFVIAQENDDNLAKMLREMHFSKVLGTAVGTYSINDTKFEVKLEEYLSKLESSDAPFLMCAYNMGTHENRDSEVGEYKSTLSGGNEYYNKFYNYDMAIGKLLKFIDNSNLHGNTLVVITSDHCAYPSAKFNTSFGTQRNVFVGKVPLYLYGPGIIKQGTFDAQGMNSTALVPTLLDILGINDVKNYFVGCSIFEKECSSIFSKMGWYNKIYVSTEGSKEHQILPTDDLKEEFKAYFRINSAK